MTPQEIATTAKDSLTAAAIVIGGWWTYLRFVRQRDAHPRCSFQLDARFIGVQDERLIVEVIATMENHGLVRHRFSDFTFNVRYILPDDKIVSGGEAINHQTCFPHSTNSDEGLDARKFVPWRPFIDPGVVQSFTYLISVPSASAFILIYSEFHYADARKTTHSAQKAFRVPKQFDIVSANP